MTTATLKARVHCLRYEARDVVSVELRPEHAGVVFPPHEAGAHIDLHMSNGLVRSYSLVNPAGEAGRYVVGVLKDRKSRGGSAFVHEQLRVGQLLTISAPRNNFPLHESAGHSVFVAGGIGITPILCMLERLSVLGHTADLIYCVRSRADAAFVERLNDLGSHTLRVHWHFDDEAGGPPDLRDRLSQYVPENHFYACGPGPMLDAFLSTCEALGYPNAHIERFAAVPTLTGSIEAATFTLELRRSERHIEVRADCSVLDAMLEAGLSPDHSCREGLCGACETRVLAGDVEHRDSILTESERAANKSMMICVSRCRSNVLVLDA
jgi:tetrachlorobenzoquinone reductase